MPNVGTVMRDFVQFIHHPIAPLESLASSATINFVETLLRYFPDALNAMPPLPVERPPHSVYGTADCPYLLAHNASFDAEHINQELLLCGCAPIPEERWLCTKALFELSIPSSALQRSLDAALSFFGITHNLRSHAQFPTTPPPPDSTPPEQAASPSAQEATPCSTSSSSVELSGSSSELSPRCTAPSPPPSVAPTPSAPAELAPAAKSPPLRALAEPHLSPPIASAATSPAARARAPLPSPLTTALTSWMQLPVHSALGDAYLCGALFVTCRSVALAERAVLRIVQAGDGDTLRRSTSRTGNDGGVGLPPYLPIAGDTLPPLREAGIPPGASYVRLPPLPVVRFKMPSNEGHAGATGYSSEGPPSPKQTPPPPPAAQREFAPGARRTDATVAASDLLLTYTLPRVVVLPPVDVIGDLRWGRRRSADLIRRVNAIDGGTLASCAFFARCGYAVSPAIMCALMEMPAFGGTVEKGEQTSAPPPPQQAEKAGTRLVGASSLFPRVLGSRAPSTRRHTTRRVDDAGAAALVGTPAAPADGGSAPPPRRRPHRRKQPPEEVLADVLAATRAMLAQRPFIDECDFAERLSELPLLGGRALVDVLSFQLGGTDEGDASPSTGGGEGVGRVGYAGP